MSSNENEFQFELREKLYFNEGELVEELMNISLDPDIRIEPSDSYVSIRGDIELRGEYKKAAKISNEEEQLVDFENFEAKRFVRQVITGGDGLMEFTHLFPVDISVPSYRVQTIDDIQVEITNFDYELPSNNQLNVTASASIYGIKEDAHLLEKKNEQESAPREIETEEESFEFEVKIQDQELEKEINPMEDPAEETRVPDQVDDRKIEVTVLEPVREVTEDRKAPDQPIEETLVEETEENITDADQSERQQENLQDVRYLTDMFHDEGEESYSQMRICIVQDEDTIETIAERFEVSTLQLIKQNELEDNYEVSVGQLLYIPQK